MESVLVSSLSGRLQKALATNSQANQYSTLYEVLSAAPDSADYTTTFPATFDAAGKGQTAPARLKLYPYAEGGAAGMFSIRVYGWQSVEEESVLRTVWFAPLLAEIACITCDRNGPTGPPLQRHMSPLERFCDTIVAVRGQVQAVSYGPGTNLIACAYVGIGGCKKFSFDFKYETPMAMNCFWSFSS